MATSDELLAQVNKLYTALQARQEGIAQRFSYYDGIQALMFATDEWKRFHENRYKGFSDNWCAVVVNSAVDRLKIRGIRFADANGDAVTADEKELWGDWLRNELGEQSTQGFLETSVAQRSYTLVWGDRNNEPEVTWESPSEVIVQYSPGSRRERVAALKAWQDLDAGLEYANLYLPDGLYKYERKTLAITASAVGIVLPSGVGLSSGAGLGGGWKPREVPGEIWPLPNPMGVVPVVEWPNRPRLNGQPISDIDGVIAMQDAINAMWGFLFPAADQASMPARVIMGGEPPKVPILDDLGQIIGSRPANMDDVSQKRFLHLSGAERIGEWKAADLEVFIKVVTECIAHIAGQTGTPHHYLHSGDKFANLNGDALTAAEVPLATKCGKMQVSMSPAGKETLALMAQVRSKDALAGMIRSSDSATLLQWEDPAMHSLAQVADAATKDRAVGMSLRTVLERRYGMTELEIDQEMARIHAEAADPIMQAMLLRVQQNVAANGGVASSGA